MKCPLAHFHTKSDIKSHDNENIVFSCWQFICVSESFVNNLAIYTLQNIFQLYKGMLDSAIEWLQGAVFPFKSLQSYKLKNKNVTS